MRAPVGMASVEGYAGLWLRIDTAGTSVNLDNGSDHPIYGTSEDWEIHEIVVDVPADADWIVYGSFLVGPGTVVVADPLCEIVTDEVPTTAPNRRPPPIVGDCVIPLDEHVEEIVHFTRTDTWKDERNRSVIGQSVLRDEDMTFNGVP